MITVANFLSHELHPLAESLSGALASATGQAAAFDPAATLDDFRQGRVAVALVCGLAYALLRDTDGARFSPAAAPLVADPRVEGVPVYFSEVVVRVDDDAQGLPGLAGRRFAYNETVSFSGYRALEHELAGRGLDWNLFDQCVRTGSHRSSLEAVASGRADVAAIDSHVLWLERRRDPSLVDAVRVMAAVGPYPAPPVALNDSGCGLSAGAVREALSGLRADVMKAAGIGAWQAMVDADYDPIRRVTAGLPGLSL